MFIVPSSLSSFVFNHEQHAGDEFTRHRLVDEFLLGYLSVTINVNNLQDFLCPFIENVIGNLAFQIFRIKEQVIGDGRF